IAGQLRHGDLVADELFLYADPLADLSRDEIILLATMYREHLKSPDTPGAQWTHGLAYLKSLGWSDDGIAATGASSLRSGFLVTQSAWDAMQFRLSPKMLTLCKTVDFDDALRQEP